MFDPYHTESVHPYSSLVEKTFAPAYGTTVTDLICWLTSIPSTAKIPPGLFIRYNYDTGELTIRTEETL